MIEVIEREPTRIARIYFRVCFDISIFVKATYYSSGYGQRASPDLRVAKNPNLTFQPRRIDTRGAKNIDVSCQRETGRAQDCQIAVIVSNDRLGNMACELPLDLKRKLNGDMPDVAEVWVLNHMIVCKDQATFGDDDPRSGRKAPVRCFANHAYYGSINSSIKRHTAAHSPETLKSALKPAGRARGVPT